MPWHKQKADIYNGLKVYSGQHCLKTNTHLKGKTQLLQNALAPFGYTYNHKKKEKERQKDRCTEVHAAQQCPNNKRSFFNFIIILVEMPTVAQTCTKAQLEHQKDETVICCFLVAHF